MGGRRGRGVRSWLADHFQNVVPNGVRRWHQGYTGSGWAALISLGSPIQMLFGASNFSQAHPG